MNAIIKESALRRLKEIEKMIEKIDDEVCYFLFFG